MTYKTYMANVAGNSFPATTFYIQGTTGLTQYDVLHPQDDKLLVLQVAPFWLVLGCSYGVIFFPVCRCIIPFSQPISI